MAVRPAPRTGRRIKIAEKYVSSLRTCLSSFSRCRREGRSPETRLAGAALAAPRHSTHLLAPPAGTRPPEKYSFFASKRAGQPPGTAASHHGASLALSGGRTVGLARKGRRNCEQSSKQRKYLSRPDFEREEEFRQAQSRPQSGGSQA